MNRSTSPRTELQRLLSKLGHCSRKEAKQLILDGKVSVNGKVCRDPLSFQFLDAKIQINGILSTAETKHVIVLNKPRGLVVTRSDEKGRPTVYDLLKDWQGPLLMPVGRLDQASEGLLLFTNDHQWAQSLMDPNAHVQKTYHVQFKGHLSPEQYQLLCDGIEIEGQYTLPADYREIRTGRVNSWLEAKICEGRNRQIRKSLEYFGVETLRLIRIGLGGFELGDLPKGHWKELRPDEIALCDGKTAPTQSN
jgi:23S rRNA pseudouridine2605 synthase